jgi:hypothetical protein
MVEPWLGGGCLARRGIRTYPSRKRPVAQRRRPVGSVLRRIKLPYAGRHTGYDQFGGAGVRLRTGCLRPLTSVKIKLNSMDTIPRTIVAARGGACTVEFVVRSSGNCPAQSFLNDDCEQIREGGKGEPESTARAKFQFLFQQMANYGNIAPKRFKKEMGKFFAFRHTVRNVQIRFPCFVDGDKWIVTHGFSKPGAQRGLGTWPSSEVKRAEELMREYFKRKGRDK